MAQTPTQLLLPTGTDYLLMLHAQLLAGRRENRVASVEVPPLRRRAWMLVMETGVIPVTVGG